MKKQIPNILTLGNVFCGCLGIICVFNGDPWMAFFMMIAGSVFDFLDGFVARALKATGELGAELDSLGDMVTFGTLPGLMMFKLISSVEPESMSYLAYFGLLITLFSAYRLAKFNVSEDQSDNFVGLPTPINAIFIASLSLIDHELLRNLYLLIGVSVVFSYLLVSDFKLIALKFKGFGFRENLEKWLLIAISIILIFTLQVAAIPFILLTYLILSFLHFKLKLI